MFCNAILFLNKKLKIVQTNCVENMQRIQVVPALRNSSQSEDWDRGG